MKNAMRAVLLVSLFVPMAAMATSFVQLDENGNGTFYRDGNPGVGTNFTGSFTIDPSGGALGGQALVYTLPFDFTQTGDYVLTETQDVNIISDVVRFWGSNQVIFYSEIDADEPFPDVADFSGLPVNQLTPSIVLSPPPMGFPWEGFHFIQYGETNQPGYAGLPLIYEFNSEIPEPSTLALAGVGLAGLALMAYRRRSE